MALLRAVVMIQAQEGLLDRLLGEVEVAEDTDEGGHGLPGLLPEHPLDQRTGLLGHPHPLTTGPNLEPPGRPGVPAAPQDGMSISMIGRTSIDPPRTSGIRTAISMASSRSLASMT